MERDSHKKTSIASLSTWCILPEGLGRTAGPRDMPDHAIKPTVALYPCKKEIWVRNGKRCVAIIRVELDGKLVLNPEGKGFDYGPIPALCDMTQLQADELWGTETKSVKGDVVTYKLMSYQSRSDLFIDMVFREDRIYRYKVRSGLIENSEWNAVKGEHDGKAGLTVPVNRSISYCDSIFAYLDNPFGVTDSDAAHSVT